MLAENSQLLAQLPLAERRKIIAQAKLLNPGLWFVPNGKQEQVLRAIGGAFDTHDGRLWGEVMDFEGKPYQSLEKPPLDPTYRNIILAGGNGCGKTALMGMTIANIVYGKDVQNEYTAGCPLFMDWPYEKRIMLLGTKSNLMIGGAVDTELKKWLIPGTYKTHRGDHKYDSWYEFPDYGWVLSLFTNEQEVKELAGPTVGLVVADEPMNEEFVGEIAARLRAGGIFCCFMTQLGQAAWMYDKMEEQPEDWLFINADIRDNCKQRGLRGHLIARQVDRTIATWPEEERWARMTGQYLGLSGRVYKEYGEDNLTDYGPEEVRRDLLEARHPPTIYQVVDPHVSKPWAMTWWASFPDGRVICFMEWPDQSCQSYHTWTTANMAAEDYVRLIWQKEQGIKVYQRIMDKTFGWQSSFMRRGNATISEEMLRASNGNLEFLPSVGDFDNQHLIVQDKLVPRLVYGPQQYKRPRLIFVDRRCVNIDYAMRRYMYRRNSGRSMEEKGTLAGKPIERFKCFPNTVEYLMGWGADWMPPQRWLWTPDPEDVSKEAGRITRWKHTGWVANYA